jgi:hypothetical protein
VLVVLILARPIPAEPDASTTRSNGPEAEGVEQKLRRHRHKKGGLSAGMINLIRRLERGMASGDDENGLGTDVLPDGNGPLGDNSSSSFGKKGPIVPLSSAPPFPPITPAAPTSASLGTGATRNQGGMRVALVALAVRISVAIDQETGHPEHGHRDHRNRLSGVGGLVGKMDRGAKAGKQVGSSTSKLQGKNGRSLGKGTTKSTNKTTAKKGSGAPSTKWSGAKTNAKPSGSRAFTPQFKSGNQGTPHTSAPSGSHKR